MSIILGRYSLSASLNIYVYAADALYMNFAYGAALLKDIIISGVFHSLKKEQ